VLSSFQENYYGCYNSINVTLVTKQTLGDLNLCESLDFKLQNYQTKYTVT